MTRILFFGDAAHTGFGTVTWDLCTRMLANGDDLRILSMNQTADPIPAPLGERTWDLSRGGVDVLQLLNTGFRDGWKPEVAIILGDYQAVRGYVIETDPALTRAFASVPTLHYCPVEGIDLPPRWAKLWEVVQPVAMSEFGADQIEVVTGSRPPVVYHGVDTDTFYPITLARPGRFQGQPIRTKEHAKAVIGLDPDRIHALRTDRHMPRKNQNRLIRDMVAAFDAEPRLDLVLHCRMQDEGGSLHDTVSKLPREYWTRIKFTNAHDSWRGLDRSDLNVLYNAADIYVTNSAEGFGLTPAEAAACGVPVVAMDYSTMPEVVGPAGVLVPVGELYDNQYDHYWAWPDGAAYAAAVVRLAKHKKERQAMGARGPKHIAAMFSWDRAARQFTDLCAAASTIAAAPALEALPSVDELLHNGGREGQS